MNRLNNNLLLFFCFMIFSTKGHSLFKFIEDKLIVSYSGGASQLTLNFSSSNEIYNTLNYADNYIGGILNFPIPSFKYKVYNDFYMEANLKFGPIRFDRKNYMDNIQNEYYPDFIIEDLDSKHSDFFVINYQFGVSYKLNHNKMSFEPKILYGKIQFNTPDGKAILKQEYSNNRLIYFWKSAWYKIPHSISFSTQFNYQLSQEISISIIVTKSFGKLDDNEYTIKTEDIYGNENTQTFIVSGSCSSYTTTEFGINYSF